MTTMRFMLLLKGDPQVDADPSQGPAATPDGQALPPHELIDAMIGYQEDLAKAGVLLAAEGLHPSVTGARVVYRSGNRTVIDGPFTEAKELVAGYYLIQVASREEAIEWAKRVPVQYAVSGDQEAVVEVRQVAEMDDLPTATAEHRAAEQRLREGYTA
jgi:hypothetical protein